MLQKLLLALLVVGSASSSVAAAKGVKTSPGSVSGVMSYSAGQYWIESGKEVLCVMVEPADEAALEPLIDAHVAFTGPDKVWPDKSRCIIVGPDFPKSTKKTSGAGVVPVVIGAHGQPDLDACLSVGAFPSAVAVRLAPSEGAGTSVQVPAGQEAYLCGASADGAWESVVIPSRPGQDCGVSGAVDAPRPYAGPCESGWVPAKQVEVIAG